jgi:hypothetical protein
MQDVSTSCLNVGHDFFQVDEERDYMAEVATGTMRQPAPPRFICRKCGEVKTLEPATTLAAPVAG